MEILQALYQKPEYYDDYDEVSLFECTSIDSPSLAASIFDELVFTDKLNLHKFLDDMAAFHDFINDTFHGMTKRTDSLRCQGLRHSHMLDTTMNSSDKMLALLAAIRIEVDQYLEYFRPEKEAEIKEVKAIPKSPPIYSSEYVDNYIKHNQNQASYKAIVAIIAMLLYVVCIRDQEG